MTAKILKKSMQNDSENTEKKKKSIQNDNTSASDSEICQTAERLERLAKSLNIPNLDHRISLFKGAISDTEKKKKNSIQNDNTSASDSEMCQFAEEMERDLRQGLTGSERSHRLWTIFKPVKKIKSTVINRKICHPVRKNSKTAKRKKSKTAKTRKKEVINKKT